MKSALDNIKVILFFSCDQKTGENIVLPDIQYQKIGVSRRNASPRRRAGFLLHTDAILASNKIVVNFIVCLSS